jgi:hypothetical protein
MALDELSQVELLVDLAKKYGEVETLCKVPYKDKKFPVYGISIGSKNPKDPTLGLFGGVHGLERVGTQVVVAFLETLLQQMSWDKDLAARMKRVRIVSIPIVNPVGMYLGTRANGNGVDLMRNAPVEGEDIPLLVGGHRLSPKLWWYRGADPQQMEPEVAAATQFVRDQMFSAKASLSLDCHSGFGLQDRLWFPYARTRAPFPLMREARAIEKLLGMTYPNHVYKVEPQSVSYTTHGDFWDLLFDEHLEVADGRPYIPWTLELGSWLWVKKNPLQLFQAQGLFNPIKPHRIRRTLRRHLLLLDFFLSAVKNHEVWSNDKKLVVTSRTRPRKKTLGRVS